MRSRALLFAGWLSIGCSADHERAPVQPCVGPDCQGPPTQGSGANGSGGGEAGAGSGGDGTGSPPVFAVSRFEGDDFHTTAPFGEPALVRADGRGGTTLEADWNGVDAFELEGLTEQPFLLVTPLQDGTDALPTLLAPRLTGSVELPVVRATVLDGIRALSSLPLDAVPGAAHLVLQLVDVQSSTPIAGLTLAETTAATVLYAAAGSWSDAVTTTDVTGLAVLADVEAADWPGRLTSVSVSGEVLAAIPLRAVSGAVTVVRVGLSR